MEFGQNILCMSNGLVIHLNLFRYGQDFDGQNLILIHFKLMD